MLGACTYTQSKWAGQAKHSPPPFLLPPSLPSSHLHQGRLPAVQSHPLTGRWTPAQGTTQTYKQDDRHRHTHQQHKPPSTSKYIHSDTRQPHVPYHMLTFHKGSSHPGAYAAGWLSSPELSTAATAIAAVCGCRRPCTQQHNRPINTTKNSNALNAAAEYTLVCDVQPSHTSLNTRRTHIIDTSPCKHTYTHICTHNNPNKNTHLPQLPAVQQWP